MIPATRAAASAAVGALLLFASTARAATLPIGLIPYASGFAAPVALVQDPTDAQVQFVVEQSGRILTIASGVVQPAPFLDIRDIVGAGGERGLLGLAFPPDAATSRRFYVYYTNLNGDSVVARFTRSGDPRIADRSTHFPLLWSTGERVIHQPYANHNGGCLGFGADGFLYVGLGDGGSGNDPDNNAQNPASLLGKMLRIDVSVSDTNAAGFVVPAGNPFVASSGYRPEIWDIGLRNPWRFSFDSVGTGATGALVIGDVGQGRWEEVDYEPAGSGGRNYGWVIREGANATVGVSGIAPAFLPLVDPVYQYRPRRGAVDHRRLHLQGHEHAGHARPLRLCGLRDGPHLLGGGRGERGVGRLLGRDRPHGGAGLRRAARERQRVWRRRHRRAVRPGLRARSGLAGPPAAEHARQSPHHPVGGLARARFARRSAIRLATSPSSPRPAGR